MEDGLWGWEEEGGGSEESVASSRWEMGAAVQLLCSLPEVHALET